MRRAGLTVPCLALALGCSGSIGDPVDQGDSPICTRVEPGPSPIRRMTRFEYNNTVRDLLGDTSRPADQFVPDEESLGFNNNAYALGVTQILAEQYMIGAETLSIAATEDMGALLEGCDPASAGEDVCAEDLVVRLGARAWRRPLAQEEVDRLMGLFRSGRDEWGFRDGIQLVIQAMLQSPHFLYRVELGEGELLAGDVVKVSPYEMASRLSYFLWGSMPDDELFASADSGALADPGEVEAQARRMLADEKALLAIENFHVQWLKLEPTLALSKDTGVFPEWSSDVRPLLLEETMSFVEYVIFEGEGDLWTLLTAPYSFMNAELAAYYGVEGAPEGGWDRVEMDPARYAGILTQASLLATNAKANQTSPVHRGKFVREQLLCQLLPPPPDDIEIVPPDLDPTLTTRERFAEHSENPACAGCHRLMDPIGFGFEHFDGIGRWRDTENEMEIDATGEITNSQDVGGAFDGVTELAYRLGASRQVGECMTRQWFRYANGRGETADDECTMQQLFETFEGGGRNIRELLVAITLTDAFQYRKAGGGQ